MNMTVKKKPDAKILNQDGNIFNLQGIAYKSLVKNGMKEDAELMLDLVSKSSSYSEALMILMKFVNPI